MSGIGWANMSRQEKDLLLQRYVDRDVSNIKPRPFGWNKGRARVLDPVATELARLQLLAWMRRQP
jgi:hypothetical protein